MMGKMIERDELDELIGDFVGLVSYNRANRWQDTPETAIDPDDDFSDDADERPSIAPERAPRPDKPSIAPGLARK